MGFKPLIVLLFQSARDPNAERSADAAGESFHHVRGTARQALSQVRGRLRNIEFF